MKIINAQAFDLSGNFINKDIYIDSQSGRFTSEKAVEQDKEIIDGIGLFAIPGLVDLHFHGCMGVDLCNGTEQSLQTMADYEASHGVLAICPATMSCSNLTLEKLLACVSTHKNTEGADLVGINLEGPFLNPKRLGAQNPDYIQAPNTELFHKIQQRAQGLVRICSISPELPGAMDFIRELKDEVIISIAHTLADYDAASEAFALGASHMTHLYNSMPGILHRAPGPIIAALEQAATIEINCDHVHIHPAIVRLTFQLFGSDRVIMISDSMMAAGLNDGQYTLGGQSVTVTGRHCMMTDYPDTIAGSNANLMDCLYRAVNEMNIPLYDAVKAATFNPAKKIGIDKDYGSLEQGRLGNVILLDKQCKIKAVIQKGKLIKSYLY